jgi:hypothetical protein
MTISELPGSFVPLPPLTSRPRARRLTLALTIALSLGALVIALIGPAETLAQTHKSACSGSAAHAKKAKSTTHPCPTHKSKVKSTTKAKHTKKKHHKSGGLLLRIPASCEDGNAPVLSEGSFHCSDGSEPQCVDGATPTASRNGKMLLCPAVAGSEGSSGEAECEEEELECVTSSGSDEEACEASASGSVACEGEAES